ncbi:hypothetical protein H0W26_01900 [Candidatus Dependentiae bacterium]|nr:hypothetical protein [Candidatus Dependentiae bacterium]
MSECHGPLPQGSDNEEDGIDGLSFIGSLEFAEAAHQAPRVAAAGAIKTDLVSNPLWATDRIIPVHVQNDPHDNLPCDAMLLHGLRASGFHFSKGQLGVLFSVMNSVPFREAYSVGLMSKTYAEADRREKKFLNGTWKQISFNNSIIFVRDLFDVVQQMCQDKALWSAMDFGEDSAKLPSAADNTVVMASDFTYYPVYQERREQTRRKHGPTVKVIPLYMWSDEGDTDNNGAPIYVLAIGLLNVPPSMGRRRDCIYPIGYVYPNSDIVDCVRYLLPELIALRDVPRFLVGSLVSYIFDLQLISGDNPAITKMLMVMQSSTARFPCKDCLIESKKSNPLMCLNDPDRWVTRPSELRTQSGSQRAIEQMFQDAHFRQTESGMNDSNLIKTNPLFDYFDSTKGTRLDVFRLRALDLMHDLYLGILKEVFSVFAASVLADKEAKKRFLQLTYRLQTERICGFTMTIWRLRDTRTTSETTLLHLLQKGNLFMREYQELAPFMPLFLHECQCEGIAAALPALVDLIAWAACMQRAEWPLNQSDDWWLSLRNFGINAYKRIRNHFNASLGKGRNLIKIHCLLVHGLDSLRSKGAWHGHQGLEGQFHDFKECATNRKEQGQQIFSQVQMSSYAGQWVASACEPAQAVRQMLDVNYHNKLQKAGLIEAIPVREEVMQALALHTGLNHIEVGNYLKEYDAVKWVQMTSLIDRGGAQRGELKIFATYSWHGREAFDIIEFTTDATYMLLLCLFQHKFTDKVVAVGYQLAWQEKGIFSFSCRMPVLRKIAVGQVTVREFELSKHDIYPCMTYRYHMPLEAEEKAKLYPNECPFDERDEFYVHIFLATYGPLCYHSPDWWHPSNNERY